MDFPEKIVIDQNNFMTDQNRTERDENAKMHSACFAEVKQMPVLTSSYSGRFMKIAFRLIAGVIVLAISAMSGTLLAEDEVEFSTIIADGSESTDTLDGISSVVPGNGMGTLFRAGHQAGKTVGLDESISHIEAMPYLFTHTKNPDDAGMLFGNFRLWRTNRGNLGGGAGLGYRFYNYDSDRIFGASFYYDRDDSTDKIFQQLALNVETMGRYWDANGNFYLPIGNRRQELGLEFNEGSQRFSEFNVLYDQTRTLGTAMRGFDAEIGVPIYGELAQQFQARAYAGTYGFQASESEDVWGWRGRLQAYPLPNVLTELSITSDDTFNTNVFFNVTWTFAGRPEWNEMEKSTQMYRMAERVRKNYNVVIEQKKVVDSGLVAINPETGLPWTISHVDSYAAPGGTGTVLDPYQTIPDAQAGPDRDIIFTHAGSFYNNAAPITLTAGERVLGEGQGVDHFINISGFGPKLLPNSPAYGDPLRPDSFVRPTFNDTVGDGVILASDSEFSGFILNDPTGRGVVGIGVSETTVNYVDVNNAVGEGIYLSSISGSLDFESTNVTNAAGDAFVVDGGDALVRYDTGTIENTGAGRAVLIQNTTGGSVNMTGSSIIDTNSQGILINNISGGAVLDNVTITGSTNEGIHVTGGSANAVVTFRNTAQAATIIDSATDASIFVEDYLGVYQMQDINILNRNGAGILVENLTGNMAVVGNTTITNGASAATDHGIDINNTSGNISFGGSLGITGSNGEGISFNNGGNTGNFGVTGTTTISGTANEAFIVLNDSPRIRMGTTNLSNNSLTNSVLLLDNAGNGGTTGTVSFGNTTATGTFATNAPVVNILNSDSTISFSSLNVNADSAIYTGIANPAVGVYVLDNPGNVNFGTLNITAFDNLALIANNNSGTLSSTGGIISVTDAAAIDIEDSNISLNLTAVNASNTSGPPLTPGGAAGDAEFYLNSAGIRLVRTPGLFGITGDGNTIEAGGTILDAQHGVWMEDIGRVNIDGLEIQIPLTSGIEWHQTTVADGPEVNLTRVRVEDSLGTGIRVVNGRSFTLSDSELLDNGNANTEHSLDYLVDIEVADTNNDIFSVILQDNTITDDSADAIRIESGGLLDDTLMSLVMERNTVTNSISDTSNLSVVWEGPLSMFINDSNNFVGTGATNNVGIEVDATSTDLSDLMTLTVTNNNSFTFAGTVSRGMEVSTEGPSNILIANNNAQGFIMGGTGSYAIRFLDLAANSNVQIDSNLINMTGLNARAIFFDLVNASSSSVIIDNNQIGLFDGNLFIDTAVGFNAMTNGPLTLGTGVNNIVNITSVGNNNSFLLFNPGGGTFDGQISLNGFLLP